MKLTGLTAGWGLWTAEDDEVRLHGVVIAGGCSVTGSLTADVDVNDESH